MENHSTASSKLIIIMAGLIIAALLAVLAWLLMPATQQPTKTNAAPVNEKLANFEPEYPAENKVVTEDSANSSLSAPTEPEVAESSSAVNSQAITDEQKEPEIAGNPTNPDEINPDTGLPYDKNDPSMLAKRKQVMMGLSEVINQTSLGTKSSTDQIISMGKEMISLTNQGYLLPADAKNTLEFIKLAYPEIEGDIDNLLAEIK